MVEGGGGAPCSADIAAPVGVAVVEFGVVGEEDLD